jgi:ribosomal protein S18 acetylase RimI-like enzyme
MKVQIRLFYKNDLADVIELSLLAWEPVFVEWLRILGPELYPIAIFADWRVGQKEEVEGIINDAKFTTWVAEVDGKVAGFVSYQLNEQTKIGEVQLLAVHPGYQNQGIGTQLNLLALEKLKEGGMKIAEVGTGGDEAHAAARKAYEKAGYTGLPLVRYYKAL